MKNSDMKAVAIILAIALFFTIVTSNAVSIASVIMLVKDGGAVATSDGGDVQQGGNQQGTTPTNNNTTPVNNNTSNNNTPANNNSSNNTTPTNNTNTNTNTDTPANNDKPQNNDQPQGGNDTPAAPANAVDAEAFNFYKAACDDIINNASAGHTRKEWQDLKSLDLGAASSVLEGVLKGFMTSEADASDTVSEKGSDDAKRRMAPCGASIDNVASASRKELPNGNYEVVIVMKDENTPPKGSNGIASMATGILYMEDVLDTVQNDSTVSKIVKSLDKGEIIYKAYTITAEMTKDGKFVSIDHVTTGELAATASVVLIGQISGGGVLEFHSKWSNFVY